MVTVGIIKILKIFMLIEKNACNSVSLLITEMCVLDAGGSRCRWKRCQVVNTTENF